MSKRKYEHIEMRYYELPQNEFVLPLLGEAWRRVYYSSPEDLHVHNLLEVGVCHEGSGRIDLEDGEFSQYQAGYFTLFPRHFPHTTNGDGDGINYWEYLFIDVEHFLETSYPDNQIFSQEVINLINKRSQVQPAAEHPVLSEAIQALFREVRDPQGFSQEVTRALILRLLLEIARLNLQGDAPANLPQKRRRDILKSLEYIDRHYAEAIKIQDLAELCHLSETHFRRLFEDVMHMVPADYINFIRIQKACELINRSGQTIEQIANLVGYESQPTFNRNFMKIMGMTPRQFRTASDNYKVRLKNYRITTLKGW